MLYVLKYDEEVIGVYNNLSKLVKAIENDMEDMETSAENYTILAIDDKNSIYANSSDIPEYTVSTGIRVLDEEGDIVEIDDDDDEDDDYED